MPTLKDLVRIQNASTNTILNPENPAGTNILSANVQLAQNILKNSQGVAKLATVQTAMHILNPVNARIINPAIVTGIVPGEGIIPNTIDVIRNDTPKAVYNSTYSKKKVSGVKVETIAQAFKPIQSGGAGFSEDSTLLEDTMLRDNFEDAFVSNAPYDQTVRYISNGELTLDPDRAASAASQQEPTVQSSAMVFPFYFESLNYKTDNKQAEKYITFQATFSNLQEIYTPSWHDRTFFGRSSKVYSYSVTDRTISFDFIIWAPNRVALGLVKQRVNWLARQCYPLYANVEYTNTKIMKQASIIRFTIGDVFKNVPGIITSLTYDWGVMENNRWELTKDMIMPQAVKATIQITILHDKLMQNYDQSWNDLEGGKASSDFYEFVKPENRGIRAEVPSENYQTELTSEEEAIVST